MPTYDYHCLSCGVFDALRPMSRCHAPAQCPACGHDAPRVIIAAPRLSAMSRDRRTAFDTNERAANEPKRSGSHGMSCACCKPISLSGAGSTASAGNTKTAALSKALQSDIKSKSGGRPWMISH